MDHGSAHSARTHPWSVDAVLGFCAALMAMTVAQAALPAPPIHSRPEAPVVPPPVPAAPPEPAVLIAFAEPLPGQPVDSPFGRRRLPWETQGRLHAGVDIAAPGGTPILASADGVVVRVGRDAGYGRFVQVKHAEGLSTFYAHIGRTLPNIAPGVAVKAGTPLGLVGSTGSSTGAHLHFEIRDSQDRPLNPALFLGRKFATAADLPLSAARRTPRGVRVAWVSRIPASKRAMMQAKLDAPSPDRTAEHDPAAAAATPADAEPVAIAVDQVTGRPHARFSPVFSADDTPTPRPEPAA